jgi:hypothetical protein
MASTLLFNPFFHRLPRLEDDGASFGHHDLFPSVWVAALTGFPPPHLEDAEVAEFDPTLLDDCIHDRVEYMMNDLAGLELCQAKLLGNRSDDVFLGHVHFFRVWNCEDAAVRHRSFF